MKNNIYNDIEKVTSRRNTKLISILKKKQQATGNMRNTSSNQYIKAERINLINIVNFVLNRYILISMVSLMIQM